MTSRLNPYLNFNGNAREAMEFYAGIFGGELTITTFGELGTEGPDADRVMHALLQTNDGYMIMAADVTTNMEYEPMSGSSVSISGDEADTDALHSYWQKLSAGGTTLMPMEKQAWGDQFGMCVDKFGVPWMIDIGSAAD
jgi:PhnB protein